MKNLLTNQKQISKKIWSTSLTFLILVACAKNQTEFPQTQTPSPIKTYTQQPTLMVKEQFNQYTQSMLTNLGENRFRFGEFFEFSLPKTWNVDKSEFVFNSTSGRYTFSVYRDPIIKDDGKEFTPNMVLVFPPYKVETAEESHAMFEVIACWCCTGNEESMPSNLLVSPSAVGYMCRTISHIKYTVYEKTFLYAMVSPVEVYPEIENEIFYLFQNVSYK